MSIVADVRDYEVAFRLAHRIIGHTFKRISQNGEKLVRLVSEKRIEESFTRKILEDLTDWNCDTVKKYIEEAVQTGYFEVAVVGTHGRPFFYRLVKTISDMPAGTLIPPEDLRQKMAADNAGKGN